MSALIPFEQAEVPAHLATVFGDDDTNITAKASINQLSYRGKVFRRIVDGEEITVSKANEDGDMVPVPIINVVVLNHNKQRSRAFYAGPFEEGKNQAPDCFSGDGVSPDPSIEEPQCAKCADCPNAVKGSKMTESGKPTTACTPYKRIAIIPSPATTEHVPLLLRLAQTSVWDKDNGENEQKGWYAWDQYIDMLRARGAKHTAAVETRIKFDARMAYPKLLFSAKRWLNPDEAVAAKEKLSTYEDDIQKILTGERALDGVAGQRAFPVATDDDETPATAAPAVKPKPAPAEADEDEAAEVAAAAKAVADAKAVAKAKKAKAAAEAAAAAAEIEEDEEAEAAAAAKAAAEAKATAKAARIKAAAEAAAAAAAAEIEEDDVPVVAAAKPKAAPKATPKPAPKSLPVEVVEDGASAPAALGALLSGWDDTDD